MYTSEFHFWSGYPRCNLYSFSGTGEGCSRSLSLSNSTLYYMRASVEGERERVLSVGLFKCLRNSAAALSIERDERSTALSVFVDIAYSTACMYVCLSNRSHRVLFSLPVSLFCSSTPTLCLSLSLSLECRRASSRSVLIYIMSYSSEDVYFCAFMFYV